jgi:anti-anti-sigma factor
MTSATPPTPTTAPTAPSDHPGLTTPLGAGATIIITAPEQGPATATVTGELDLACAELLAEALRSALDAHTDGVLLDLAGVSFFDCASLHALQQARRHAECLGRCLVLQHSSAAVDLVLALFEDRESHSARYASKPEQPTSKPTTRHGQATQPRPHPHRRNLATTAPQA